MASVDEINSRLKSEGFRVSVSVRGKRGYLYLLATLPPKPDGFKSRPYQQRIALGYPVSAVGLRQAETQARLLGTQLITGTFEWDKWIKQSTPQPDSKTGKQLVEEYRQWVFANKLQKYPNKQVVWRDRYWNVGIAKLNIDVPLTLKHFKSIAKKQKPDSAQAKYVYREIRKFGVFCQIEGIEKLMSEFKSSYNQSRARERIVPTDDEVSELIPKILNDQWRYVFGMMATYGLRNHEVWYSHIEERVSQNGQFTIPACVVRAGKTGARVAYPMPADWVNLFSLKVGTLPCVDFKDLGKYAGRAWRRQCSRIGENPDWQLYGLRHAYAIRCLTNQIPDAVAAKWMGHGVDMFRGTYSKWINQSLSEDIWFRSAALKPSDN